MVLPLGGIPLTAGSNSAFNVGGKTLSPGGVVTAPSGQVVSLAPDGSHAVIDGSTQALSPAPSPAGGAASAPPILTFDNAPITANAASNFVIHGTTVAPGGPAATIDGTVVSIPPGGTVAVINGATQSIDRAPGGGVYTPVLTVDGSTVTAGPGGSFVLSGQNLVPGGPPVTVNGHTISLFGPAPSAAVIDGKTQLLVPVPVPTGGASGAGNSPVILTFGGHTYTANSAGSFVLGSQTLVPGGPAVTVDGTTLSLLPTPTAAVIDGSTESLVPAVTAVPTAVIMIGGKTYTADAGGKFVVDGTTISPGGSAVVAASATETSVDVLGGSSTSISLPTSTNGGTRGRRGAGMSLLVGALLATAVMI